ncbi:DUF4388 domain-containing protein [Chamaesiphon minutus]|uniref:PatA-like N-terminal domain-containing protein n=1 Tax=Chamaesiphon minutus (strain ATCC 27169 / PCC 6605) TaxID=1173020 RepID=K9UI20_CHAP6|nr:DUF4388 domain-containing protein [Chamaesiphon minutus]AFY93839.1 hypothetical protein Cha6605_2802 [Chamaesiphon minutus PCC 6605]
MSLTGYLSEYSLPEIFNFVREGSKTGLLSIESDRCLSRSLDNSYYISFQTGRIVSVSNGHGLQDLGLLKMMEQRRWLTSEQLTGLSINAHKLGQPLGTYLKSCNVLDAEQLRLLFDSQVVARICKLFGETHYGQFNFDPLAPLIYTEMTGISLTAQDVCLRGLRMLRDWNDLTAKLPAPESALHRVCETPTDLRLDSQESKVWQLAVGEISIAQIAQRLGLEIDRVRQISFRLCAIGLLQEVSPPEIRHSRPYTNELAGGDPSPSDPVDDRLATTPVSASFLSKLMGFLKKKE